MAEVSVIIPNYNHAAYLTTRLDSVINQTYKDIEIIVLDDCSTDGSRTIINEYLKKDRRITVDFNMTNSGSTFKQWNKGVHLSKGKFIWIAESDDVADLTFLEKAVAVLNQHSQSCLVYSNSYIINSDGETIDTYLKWVESIDPEKWRSDYTNKGIEEVKNYLLYRNVIPNVSACVIRRDSYLQTGAANEEMKLCGDWLLYLNLLLKNDISYIAEPLNYYRIHISTVRNKYFYSLSGFEEVWNLFSLAKERLEIADNDISISKFNFIAGIWLQSLSNAGLEWNTIKSHFKYYKNISQYHPGLKKDILKMYLQKAKSVIKGGK